jgi:hypothetical protein
MHQDNDAVSLRDVLNGFHFEVLPLGGQTHEHFVEDFAGAAEGTALGKGKAIRVGLQDVGIE